MSTFYVRFFFFPTLTNQSAEMTSERVTLCAITQVVAGGEDYFHHHTVYAEIWANQPQSCQTLLLQTNYAYCLQ